MYLSQVEALQASGAAAALTLPGRRHLEVGAPTWMDQNIEVRYAREVDAPGIEMRLGVKDPALIDLGVDR